MSFVVADDEADVKLSRSTREQFLRKLVVEMKVRKNEFDAITLTEFTQQFSTKHDFEIEPSQFIASFVSKGLIHAEGGKYQITLSFMESYLLARELSENKELASEYFELQSSDFDLATFDLYAELGASGEITNYILTALEKHSAEPIQPDEHVLSNNLINPPMLRHEERLNAFRKTLNSAAKDVRERKDVSQEKQRVLDTADKVREKAARRSNQLSIESSEFQADQRSLSELSKIWSIATILLGSGAEPLEANTKRALASAIVVTASNLIEKGIRLFMSIDFDKLRDDLLADPTTLGMDNSNKDAEKIITTTVEFFEYQTLSIPIVSVLYFLCETARQKVLATSISTVQTKVCENVLIIIQMINFSDTNHSSTNIA